MEATPELFVQAMVDVFREVRRVLRGDGTLWLNLGSSYATGTDADRNPTSTEGADVPASWAGRSQPIRRHPSGFKPKDMVPIPWMVAMALQADGWWLRSDIIWAKPNPMPESVTDRPTKAHEYVFLLSKSPRYFFDQEAVREAAEWNYWGAQNRNKGNGGDPRVKDPDYKPDGRDALRERGGRNVRSVWEIATQPYPDAHFATFPEALPERCIKAGTSERGCCPVCGAPFVREVDHQTRNADRSTDTRYVSSFADAHGTDGRDGRRLISANVTTGWRSTCEHHAGDGDAESRRNGDEDARLTAARNGSPGPTTVPCVVLDPFMGSGTTALVARRLGRRSIGVELNESYAALCARRLQQLSLLTEGVL